jgi:hypothetical protein
MKSFADFATERRRLLILRQLTLAPAYTLDDVAIGQRLTALGHATSRDRLHTDLNWLSEQELLVYKTADTIYVCTLAARGGDVAQGLASVPGVASPQPGE